MPSRGKPSASQKRKRAFVDGKNARRYPGSMKPGIRSANHASLTSTGYSPGTSTGPSGGPSAGASQSDRGEAAQTTMPARFAGLRVCRHLCIRLDGSACLGVSHSDRRDLSRLGAGESAAYRLRAGYATLLRNDARTYAERRRGGSGSAARCSVGVDGEQRCKRQARLDASDARRRFGMLAEKSQVGTCPVPLAPAVALERPGIDMSSCSNAPAMTWLSPSYAGAKPGHCRATHELSRGSTPGLVQCPGIASSVRANALASRPARPGGYRGVQPPPFKKRGELPSLWRRPRGAGRARLT